MSLNGKTVLRVGASNCRAILVIPMWPSATFWPYLINCNGTFKSVVADSMYVEVGKDVFQQGENFKSFSGSHNFNSAVAVLLFDAVLSYE